jgi:hypothetical protein
MSTLFEGLLIVGVSVALSYGAMGLLYLLFGRKNER